MKKILLVLGSTVLAVLIWLLTIIAFSRENILPEVVPNQFIFSSITPIPFKNTFAIPCVSLNISFQTKVIATAPVTAGK